MLGKCVKSKNFHTVLPLESSSRVLLYERFLSILEAVNFCNLLFSIFYQVLNLKRGKPSLFLKVSHLLFFKLLTKSNCRKITFPCVRLQSPIYSLAVAVFEWGSTCDPVLHNPCLHSNNQSFY